jgi:hypothetical protein
MDNYKGFALFNDVQDIALRNRNRAVVLANLAIDHTKKATKRISPRGAGLVLGYFNCIPDDDRASVEAMFKQRMMEEGYVLS